MMGFPIVVFETMTNSNKNLVLYNCLVLYVQSMYIRPTVTASIIPSVLPDLFDTLKAGTKGVIPWLLAYCSLLDRDLPPQSVAK